MHSEICQTFRTQIFLGNGQLRKFASHFHKKLPIRCIMWFQARKLDDDTDNKGTSKLT